MYAIRSYYVGNLMCERFPYAKFSASYYVRGDGKRNYSLRSIGDFDVSSYNFV